MNSSYDALMAASDICEGLAGNEPKGTVARARLLDARNAILALCDSLPQESVQNATQRRYIPHHDAWALYCKAWRECFPNSKEQPSMSVAALSVFADMLQSETERRIGPDDRRANDPNAPNMPYRRMSAGRRAGDAERRQMHLSETKQLQASEAETTRFFRERCDKLVQDNWELERELAALRVHGGSKEAAQSATGRSAVIEECAKVCEGQQWLYGGRSHSMMACLDCAKAIRTLDRTTKP